MAYDPKQPHHLRYSRDGRASSDQLHDRIVRDSRTLCQALGYDFNTVEFAVENGIPYAIDFLNPAPDADVHSVGEENFDWVVENVAQLAIDKALSEPGDAPTSVGSVPSLRHGAVEGNHSLGSYNQESYEAESDHRN